jgi:hypothetical protein
LQYAISRELPSLSPRELFIYYNELPRMKLPPKELPLQALPEAVPQVLFLRELFPREFFIYYSELLPREKV